MQHFKCDSLIIGAGQAAPGLAVSLAKSGETVILVEALHLGGSCVNVGCTPTKTLRKSARVAHMARRGAEFGVLTGEVRVDFAKAMTRMHERVQASRSGLEDWLASTPGVQVIKGFAQLTDKTDSGFHAQLLQTPSGAPLQADTAPAIAQIQALKVYLNTGTRPFVPPIAGINLAQRDPRILSNEELLQLRECPQHLVILGASYIGLEFAQIMRRLGARGFR